VAGEGVPLVVKLLDRFPTGRRRAWLLHLLAHARLGGLSTLARAVLVRALASEGRALRTGSARAIADVLLGTSGLELTLLKRALDVGGARHDLFRLVYRDLARSPAAQAEVLQHLALEAGHAREELAASGMRLPLQVVSDFDDTLRQGWLDKRVPKHTTYPGVGHFVTALLRRAADLNEAPAWEASGADAIVAGPMRKPSRDAGTGRHGGASAEAAVEALALAGGWLRTHRRGDRAESRAMRRMVPSSAGWGADEADGDGSDSEDHRPEDRDDGPGHERDTTTQARQTKLASSTAPNGAAGELVILTARPSGAFDILRRQTLDGLAWIGVEHVSVLTGSLTTGVSTAAIAELKASNLTMHLALWRERNCVFVGDSGQGDAAVAAEALARHRKQVLAAFVHDVNPESATTGDGSHKHALRMAGVLLFHNYAEAAGAALRIGLIDGDDALSIATAASAEAAQLLDTSRKHPTSDHGPEAAAAAAAAGPQAGHIPYAVSEYVATVLSDADLLLRA